MLHPAVGEHVDEEVTIQGHRIRFATVDLNASPQEIIAAFLDALSATRAPGKSGLDGLGGHSPDLSGYPARNAS